MKILLALIIIAGIVIYKKIHTVYDKNKEVLLKTKYITDPSRYISIPIKKGVITLPETDLSKTFLISYDKLIFCIDNVKREVYVDLESIGEGDDEDVHWW